MFSLSLPDKTVFKKSTKCSKIQNSILKTVLKVFCYMQISTHIHSHLLPPHRHMKVKIDFKVSFQKLCTFLESCNPQVVNETKVTYSYSIIQ